MTILEEMMAQWQAKKRKRCVELHVVDGKVMVDEDQQEALESLLNPAEEIEAYLQTEPDCPELQMLAACSLPSHWWPDIWYLDKKISFIVYNKKVLRGVLYATSDEQKLTFLVRNKMGIILPLYPEDGDVIYMKHSDAAFSIPREHEKDMSVFMSTPEEEAEMDEFLAHLTDPIEFDK